MKEQKIKEVMFFGSTIEELVSVVEKSLPWATCEEYCLDCIQTGFSRYEIKEIAKGMIFREDLNKLVDKGWLASYKSFCQSFGDNKERVKRLVDALCSIGITAEEVDEYTKKTNWLITKKGLL